MGGGGLGSFVVYFWWKAGSIFWVRYCILPSAGVSYCVCKVVVVKGILVGCVYHKSAVVCWAQKFPVG